MDILPFDTKDEEGGERYMPFQPGHHLTYRPPKVSCFFVDIILLVTQKRSYIHICCYFFIESKRWLVLKLQRGRKMGHWPLCRQECCLSLHQRGSDEENACNIVSSLLAFFHWRGEQDCISRKTFIFDLFFVQKYFRLLIYKWTDWVHGTSAWKSSCI